MEANENVKHFADVETVIEQDSSEEKGTENNDPCCILVNNSIPQDFASVVSSEIVNDQEIEKTVEEVRDCLPSWATQEQILELIRCLGRNIVEIVNNFYERETEFYEQVSAFISSTSATKTSLADDAVPNSQPSFVKSIPCENADARSSQVFNLQSTNISPWNSLCLGKRKKKMNSKPRKKAKSNLKLKSDDPKQSTITKFFNKVV